MHTQACIHKHAHTSEPERKPTVILLYEVPDLRADACWLLFSESLRAAARCAMGQQHATQATGQRGTARAWGGARDKSQSTHIELCQQTTTTPNRRRATSDKPRRGRSRGPRGSHLSCDFMGLVIRAWGLRSIGNGAAEVAAKAGAGAGAEAGAGVASSLPRRPNHFPSLILP